MPDDKQPERNLLASVDWERAMRTEARVQAWVTKGSWMPPARPGVPAACRVMVFEMLLPVWAGQAIKPGSDIRAANIVLSTTS